MKLKGLLTLLLIGATCMFFPTKLYAKTIIECADCTSTEIKDAVELYVLQNGLSDGEYVLTTFDPVRISIQDAVAKVHRSTPNGDFDGMPSLGIDTSVTVNLVQRSSDYLEALRKLRLHNQAISDLKRMVIETFDLDPGIFLQPGGPLNSVADALKDKTSTGFYIEDKMRKFRDLGPENASGKIDVRWGEVLSPRLRNWIDEKLGFDAFIVVYVEFPDGTLGELKVTLRPGTLNFYEVVFTGKGWFANGQGLIPNIDIVITQNSNHLPRNPAARPSPLEVVAA